MGSLDAINGPSGHFPSHTNASEWWDTRNHDHVRTVALGHFAHGCTHEDGGDTNEQEKLSLNVVKILQCYIHSLQKEPHETPMRAIPATSHVESATKSRIHKLCAEIHALVSRSSRPKICIYAGILLMYDLTAQTVDAETRLLVDSLQVCVEHGNPRIARFINTL